jgi:hypothetical protein
MSVARSRADDLLAILEIPQRVVEGPEGTSRVHLVAVAGAMRAAKGRQGPPRIRGGRGGGLPPRP